MENNQNIFTNQPPFQSSSQPPFDFSVSPSSSTPKNSKLPLILIVLAAVLLIAGLTYFSFLRPQDSPRESSELSTTTTSEETDIATSQEEADFLDNYNLPEDIAFEELEEYVESHNLSTATSDDIDIPDDYGIDERRLNRLYLPIAYDDSLFESYTPNSSSLIYNTLSDYFSYAYPNYASLTLIAGSDNSSFELISNTEKKYTISLTTSSEDDLLKVSSLTIFSDSGQPLLTHTDRFTYDSEDDFNNIDFEDIFEEETNEE